MKSVKTFFTDDRELTLLQNNVKDFVQQLSNVPILDSVLLENVSLTAGSPNKIQHPLTRAPIGFWVVRKNLATDVWDDQTGNPIPDKIFVLNCTVNCTVSLLLF